jgi:hypothetical protein
MYLIYIIQEIGAAWDHISNKQRYSYFQPLVVPYHGQFDQEALQNLVG